MRYFLISYVPNRIVINSVNDDIKLNIYGFDPINSVATYYLRMDIYDYETMAKDIFKLHTGIGYNPTVEEEFIYLYTNSMEVAEKWKEWTKSLLILNNMR